MTPDAAVAAALTVGIPAGIVTAAYLAYRLGTLRADRPPVLTAVDEDDDTGLYVYAADVEFGATGNRDTFVIVDPGGVTPAEAKRTIQDQVDGATVKRINQHRLYAFPNGGDTVDV